MIRNYLKVAWRSLYKNRSASLISAASLAIGMAVAILIATWIQDELTYNTSFENYPRIAQVMQHQNFNGDVHTDKAISIPLATKLRQDYGDDFTFIVLSSWTNSHLLSFREKNISFTGNYMEPDAAKMLTLKMVQGSRDNLSDPSSLLICQNVRKAIFGNDNAVGQIVKLDGKELKVAGVYENLPAGNSFHDVNFIAPWALFSKDDDVKNAQQDWGVNSFQLFSQIAEGRDMHRVSLKIKNFKRSELVAEC